jgi:hypothetical protein
MKKGNNIFTQQRQSPQRGEPPHGAGSSALRTFSSQVSVNKHNYTSVIARKHNESITKISGFLHFIALLGLFVLNYSS